MTPEERVRISNDNKGGLFIFANGLLNDMRIGGLACHDLAYTIRQCIAEAVAEERERMQAELDATREQAKRVEEERDLLAGIFDQFLCFDLPGNVRVIHVCDDDDKDIWRLIYCDKPRGPEQRPPESYPTALAAIRAALAKAEVPNG